MFDFFAHARKLTTNKEPGNANEYRSAKKDPFGHGLLFIFQDPAGDFVRALEDPASQERENVYNNFFFSHYILSLIDFAKFLVKYEKPFLL